MALVYSGGPIVVNGVTYTREDQPATIITNASTVFNILAFQNILLRISGNGGATWTDIPWIFAFPFGPITPPNVQLAVDLCNLVISGTAPNDLEWFVPNTTNPSNGMQIGVRTKTYTGPNALLQFVSGSTINTSAFNLGPGKLARGIEGFTRLLQKPDPGDPFTGLSVDLYKTGLRSRSLNITGRLSRNTESTGKYKAISTDGTSIIISPIAGVEFDYTVAGVTRPFQVYDDKGSTIGAANLNPPGAFAANTWYYIYAYWFPGNLVTQAELRFEISATRPNVYRLYKGADPSRKYLFSFRTDGMAKIIPFIRDGHITRYLSGNNILNAASAAVDTVVDASSFIPPNSRNGLIRFYIDNTAVGANTYAYLKPNPVGTVDGCLLGAGANNFTDVQTWIISGYDQKYLYSTPVGATLITLDVWGFLE